MLRNREKIMSNSRFTQRLIDCPNPRRRTSISATRNSEDSVFAFVTPAPGVISYIASNRGLVPGGSTCRIGGGRVDGGITAPVSVVFVPPSRDALDGRARVTGSSLRTSNGANSPTLLAAGRASRPSKTRPSQSDSWFTFRQNRLATPRAAALFASPPAA